MILFQRIWALTRNTIIPLGQIQQQTLHLQPFRSFSTNTHRLFNNHHHHHHHHNYHTATTIVTQASTLCHTAVQKNRRHQFSHTLQLLHTKQSLNHSDDDETSSSSSSSDHATNGDYTDFALDPYSPVARSITSSLGITEEQHDQLTSLACLVVEWNERLNLVSRKDCSIPIVFGRHILPSIAIGAVSPSNASTTASAADNDTFHRSIRTSIFSLSNGADTSSNTKKTRVIDVGTGGGFPGLPLAILFPHVEFLLIDSIGKKLKAIEEMTQALHISNVKTYHGRVEEMSSHPIHGLLHKNAYDFCVARSVAALPTFCFWIQDLLKEKHGQLLYIIGGDINPYVQSKILRDIPINHIFQREDISEKHILIFPSKHVLDIAAHSGEKKRIVGVPRIKSSTKSSSSSSNANRKTSSSQGAWKKRDNSIKKDRGYNDFKRYES